MANRSTGYAVRQMHRLLKLGSMGATTDEQLLDWFASGQNEAAAAAFEELMIRHGPMVLRVCRSVLRNSTDAEDAFQAVFLILAHRANSIRRRGSVASWLFGVAHRVASRARGEAARRRARELRVAAETVECYVATEESYDAAPLHDEINRLSDRLRAAVVLCYIEGMTYDAAARQLGVSEGTIRGRLARAREHLRRRLTARGVTVPAGLLIAGLANEAQAAIPVTLAHTTVRIALGFMAGNTARILARGVLNAMLVNRLRVAVLLTLIGIGGYFCAWLDEGKAETEQSEKQGAAPKPNPAPMTEPKASAEPYRLSGIVRTEEAGEPIAGAKLLVHGGAFYVQESDIERVVESGVDGRFTVNLPPGHVYIQLAEPPIGYCWVTNTPTTIEELFVGPDEPAIDREYRVRKGTVWNFQLTRGPRHQPCRGFLSGGTLDASEEFQAQVDDHGEVHLTLPSKERIVLLRLHESSRFSAELDTGFLSIRLQWDSDFRPDELRQISPLISNRGYRLTDENEKSATLSGNSPLIEPVIANGKLVIRVKMPDRGPADFGAVTGQILDEKDRPIPGVRVGLAGKADRVSNELRHQSTTNAEGRYRLRDIPRTGIDGSPLSFQLVVVKEGYGGLVSRPLTFKDDALEKFQTLDPVRLQPGVSIRGIVVDYRGQPVAGARVASRKPVVYRGLSEKSQTATTDKSGRFTLNDLRRGSTTLIANAGTVTAVEHQLLRSPQSFLLQLPEERRRGLHPLERSRSKPLRPGDTAEEWQVGRWSDGQPHELADDRGQPVVLYFWGTDFRQSVEALPALAKLAAEFEPRGVRFRSIHRPDKDETRSIDVARKLLAEKKCPLVFAHDRVWIDGRSLGVTAERYGVLNFPLVVLIDRHGKVAFRSDMTAGDGNVAAVFLKILTEPETMTEEKANALVERAINAEIESLLKQDG